MNKLPYYLAMFVLGIIIISIFVVFLWLVIPYTPITFNNVPFKVNTKIVKQGGSLIYNVDYCKENDLIPEATKSFVNGIIHIVPAEVVVAKKTGCAIVKVQTIVPLTLPAGEYVLKISYRYQVNPVRSVDIGVETEKFTVIEK
jgi:hypothetical protein